MHDEPIAKEKLTLILRLNVYFRESCQPGKLFQVFDKHGTEKRRKQSSPQSKISINPEAGLITVPGRFGKTICTAVEDLCAAPYQTDLAKTVQESTYELDCNITTHLKEKEFPESIDKPGTDDTKDENDSGEPPCNFDMDSKPSNQKTATKLGDESSVAQNCRRLIRTFKRSIMTTSREDIRFRQGDEMVFWSDFEQ